jgi:Tol biopolymer transport system component
MKLICCYVVAAALVFAQASPDMELKAAMHQEQVLGDLKGAIAAYRKITEKYPDNRVIVARAMIQMAQCHEKLGDAQARNIYERVVREFGDQREQAAIASARLAPKPRSAGVTSRKLFESSTLSFPYEAVSADGRYIAYPSIQPGPRGLMIRNVASGQERQLTDYGMSQLATTSAFSPDSRMIAFRVSKRPDAQDLRIVRTDGTGERVIFENENVTASHPQDWSPDGKHVLAVLSTKDRTRQISIIAVSDGSVRRIKTSDWRLGPPDDALFSLDGRHIVYDQLQQEGASAADIFLLAADGSREVRLIEHPADDKVVGWAPDGRLLFTSNRSGTRDLYALRVSDARANGEAELIQRNVPGLSHRVTRTGALHYIGFHKVNGAYIAGLDVENGKLTAPVPVTETARDYNWTPAFSPDGKQAAVISFREVGKMYVIIKSLTSNEEREIYVKGLRVGYDLLWHPDGKSLLIRGNDAGFQWGIHQLDLATGGLEKPILKAGENNLGQFELSPDGSILYYNFLEPSAKKSTLISRNLITGEERELYQTDLTGRSNFSFALAPGGKRIALVDDRDWNKADAASWIVLDVESGKTRNIPNISRGTFAPVWTPDGKYLVFTSRQSWFRASVEDGSLTELGPAVAGTRATKRMHPDGSRLAFFTIKEISEFWVMENLFPKQVGSR